MTVPPKPQVDEVRAFNRFYTRQAGLLEEGLLHSAFSLTEARVLYELATRENLTAAELCRDLGLDAGYLSRLLKRFEERGLIERRTLASDARQVSISLTEAGRQAFAPLDAESHRQVAAQLAALDPAARSRLVCAMRTIRAVLGGEPPKVPYLLRPPRIGDVGWIVHRQGLLYAQEYGWDETYEGLVAEILAAFVKDHDPRRERGWIAERQGEVVGSVFLVRRSDTIAKLRLLYVEPSARGLGIGARLVEECIAFARSCGYRTMTLWTNDILGSARRIYEAAGFRLVEEDRHRSFGKDLVGQTWELELQPLPGSA